MQGSLPPWLCLWCPSRRHHQAPTAVLQSFIELPEALQLQLLRFCGFPAAARLCGSGRDLHGRLWCSSGLWVNALQDHGGACLVAVGPQLPLVDELRHAFRRHLTGIDGLLRWASPPSEDLAKELEAARRAVCALQELDGAERIAQIVRSVSAMLRSATMDSEAERRGSEQLLKAMAKQDQCFDAGQLFDVLEAHQMASAKKEPSLRYIRGPRRASRRAPPSRASDGCRSRQACHEEHTCNAATFDRLSGLVREVARDVRQPAGH